MTHPIFIFDWDGTLVDSERHIVKSLEFASNSLQLPQRSHDEYKDIIGLGMREALQQLYPALSEKDIGLMREKYAEYFFTNEMTAENLFEGVLNTLETLKSNNINLAVATGKSRHGLDKALESTGLRRFFDIERCADETKSKPNPLMLREIAAYYGRSYQDFVMVGDTEYDLKMASQLAMPSVGVSYGVHDAQRLDKHKPLRVIDEFAELLKLFGI